MLDWVQWFPGDGADGVLGFSEALWNRQLEIPADAHLGLWEVAQPLSLSSVESSQMGRAAGHRLDLPAHGSPRSETEEVSELTFVWRTVLPCREPWGLSSCQGPRGTHSGDPAWSLQTLLT